MQSTKNRPPNTIPVFIRDMEELRGHFIGFYDLEALGHLRSELHEWSISKDTSFYFDGLADSEIDWCTPCWTLDPSHDPSFYFEFPYTQKEQ